MESDAKIYYFQTLYRQNHRELAVQEICEQGLDPDECLYLLDQSFMKNKFLNDTPILGSEF